MELKHGKYLNGWVQPLDIENVFFCATSSAKLTAEKNLQTIFTDLRNRKRLRCVCLHLESCLPSVAS